MLDSGEDLPVGGGDIPDKDIVAGDGITSDSRFFGDDSIENNIQLPDHFIGMIDPVLSLFETLAVFP